MTILNAEKAAHILKPRGHRRGDIVYGIDRRPPRALLVVATATALAPVGTAATPPAITVAVDGTTLDDGDSILVETDPTLDVSVDANRSIRVVSVRVDGTTVHRATPNDTAFDSSIDLDVSSGEHTVTVVVGLGAVARAR